jgi:hypothetical protein
MYVNKEQLYDALGELIYAVAKADGLVQESETIRLEELLMAHPWAREIKWSFKYEQGRENSVQDAYAKALETCKNYGQSEEYDFLFEVLEAVGAANGGMTPPEREVIDRFQRELKEHFVKRY